MKQYSILRMNCTLAKADQSAYKQSWRWTNSLTSRNMVYINYFIHPHTSIIHYKVKHRNICTKLQKNSHKKHKEWKVKHHKQYQPRNKTMRSFVLYKLVLNCIAHCSILITWKSVANSAHIYHKNRRWLTCKSHKCLEFVLYQTVCKWIHKLVKLCVYHVRPATSTIYLYRFQNDRWSNTIITYSLRSLYKSLSSFLHRAYIRRNPSLPQGNPAAIRPTSMFVLPRALAWSYGGTTSYDAVFAS